MRHHRLFSPRGRIEIGVQHAAAIGELQLAHRGFANVEPGRAEHPGQCARIRPHQRALLGKGAALGTVLAFMMSVIALSLPEMIILKQVLTYRLIAVFIGIVGSGILAVGVLFNLIF